MYFDTHAHYDDEAFDEDRTAVLDDISKSNIGCIINPGCDVKSSAAARDLANNHDFIYFAAGLHPEEILKSDERYLEEIKNLAKDTKCVAIGEIGLDYYWDDSNKSQQKKVFKDQIELAVEMNLPVIIHDREAHGDCLEIIREYPDVKGVFHCYSGSAEMAKELLKKGFYLGFDGPVTYKNNKKAIEVLEICPTDRILIETDSPYLSPVPNRGHRNDSRNLKFIAEKISDVKNIPLDEIIEITYNNAKCCFNLN